MNYDVNHLQRHLESNFIKYVQKIICKSCITSCVLNIPQFFGVIHNRSVFRNLLENGNLNGENSLEHKNSNLRLESTFNDWFLHVFNVEIIRGQTSKFLLNVGFNKNRCKFRMINK